MRPKNEGMDKVQPRKSADYEVTFPSDEKTTIIVEVKEIGFDFEVKLTEGSPVIELPETGSWEGRFRSSDRVRNKIHKASKQLQPHTERNVRLAVVGAGYSEWPHRGPPAAMVGDSALGVEITPKRTLE